MKSNAEPIEGKICTVFYIIMVAVIGLQVFCRFILNFSFAWTEEIARFLVIWAVFLGAGYAVVKDAHIKITIGINILPKKVQFWVTFLTDILVLIFCGIVVYYGVLMVLKLVASKQIAPGTGLLQGYVFIALPLGMFIMAIRKIFVIKDNLRSLKDKSEEVAR